ncbi:hypothetical protein ACW9YQ_13465 [Paraburkholderia strydomiana]
MLRMLIVIGVLATTFLWRDAVRATALPTYLWITAGVVGACCAAIFLIWAVRLYMSQSTGPVRASDLTDPSSPVGLELASEVADRLDAGHVLAHGHAYYCGMGLTRYGDACIYSVVEDGEVITARSGEEFAKVVEVAGGKMFKSRAEFIEWLSRQTDSSLHGDGNQNLTLERLRLFASFSMNESTSEAF